VKKLERTRFRCAQELFETPWDFFFVMFSGTDWIQHEAYGDLLQSVESPAVALARSFYQDLDEYLGWFLSKLGPEDYFFLVSDHGFRLFSGTFNINRWLLSNGYLREKFGSSQFSVMAAGRSALKIPSPVVQAVSRHRRLWRLALRTWRGLAAESALAGRTRPDPSTSVAFSQDTSWGIRLNSKRIFPTGILDEAAEEKTIARLKADMEDLVGRGVIANCMLGSDVYSGPYADRAPDLVVFPGNLNFTNSAYGSIGHLARNGHSPEGVYLVHGPGVTPKNGREVSICDVLPTIMTIFDLEIPNDLDGSSLWGTPRERKGEAGETLSHKVLTEAEEKMIEERLRSLGYV
jgi:predicted AlkP superfamily phosphohydrolase/phosphomutase